MVDDYTNVEHQRTDDSEISDFMDRVLLLKKEGNTRKLDVLLQVMDISWTYPEIIVGLAVITANQENVYRNRNYYLKRATQELNNRGLLGEEMLGGL